MSLEVVASGKVQAIRGYKSRIALFKTCSKFNIFLWYYLYVPYKQFELFQLLLISQFFFMDMTLTISNDDSILGTKVADKLKLFRKSDKKKRNFKVCFNFPTNL